MFYQPMTIQCNFKNEQIKIKISNSYMKTKIGTFGAKFYTYVWGLNVPGDDMECEHFTVISINSFFVHKKKNYMQL